MKHISFFLAATVLLAACDTNSLTVDECQETLSDVPLTSITPVAAFVDGDSPEGITVDCAGNIHVGVRNGTTSRVDRINPTGGRATLFMLPDHAESSYGVLGLATGADGTLYAAHPANNQDHGVYRRRGGVLGRIPGSEGMTMPNAITTDGKGTVWVSDSFGPSSVLEPGGGCELAGDCGAIWKTDDDGVLKKWLTDPLLDSVPFDAPFAIPGPNGIAFFPPSTVFVVNQARVMLLAIPVLADGSPGEIQVRAAGPELATIDGISVGEDGSVYGVLAAANAEELGAPPVPPVVRIDPSGTVEPLVADASLFDTPTSLTFGLGERYLDCLYVVNAAMFGPATQGPGPGVVEVPVGAPGLVIR